MQSGVTPIKSTRLSREAKSYLVSFTTMPRDVYWFNDAFEAFTWSQTHVHPDWGELAYVRHGCMVMCTALGNYMVQPDCAVWIPPGMPHGWYIPCDSWDCALYIVPEVLKDRPHFGTYHVLGVTPVVRELILHLSEKPWPYEDPKTAKVVDVLLDLLKELRVKPSPVAMPRDPRLIELCATLLTNPGTSYSMAEWGRLLGMCERTLSRLFVREIGMGFREWRSRIRLEHASRKLLAGESVTGVAMECGYSSVSAFIEKFKLCYGVTPGQMHRSGN